MYPGFFGSWKCKVRAKDVNDEVNCTRFLPSEDYEDNDADWRFDKEEDVFIYTYVESRLGASGLYSTSPMVEQATG